ncbi:MAG: DUF4157 domain-containing protein [Alphaproteobacteria bacterium]|nr:DUF4157 domain-containing protein [Alphaproteobacteria bacterium]
MAGQDDGVKRSRTSNTEQTPPETLSPPAETSARALGEVHRHLGNAWLVDAVGGAEPGAWGERVLSALASERALGVGEPLPWGGSQVALRGQLAGGTVSRKPDGAGLTDAKTFQQRVRQVGQGRPLTEAEQGFLEWVHGQQVPELRLHEGPAAREAARMVGAEGFAVGRDVFVGRSLRGGGAAEAELLAHEATHVLQHREGRLPGPSGDGLTVSEPHQSHEREADALGERGRELHDALRSEPEGLEVHELCETLVDETSLEAPQPAEVTSGDPAQALAEDAERALAELEGAQVDGPVMRQAEAPDSGDPVADVQQHLRDCIDRKKPWPESPWADFSEPLSEHLGRGRGGLALMAEIAGDQALPAAVRDLIPQVATAKSESYALQLVTWALHPELRDRVPDWAWAISDGLSFSALFRPLTREASDDVAAQDLRVRIGEAGACEYWEQKAQLIKLLIDPEIPLESLDPGGANDGRGLRMGAVGEEDDARGGQVNVRAGEALRGRLSDGANRTAFDRMMEMREALLAEERALAALEFPGPPRPFWRPAPNAEAPPGLLQVGKAAFPAHLEGWRTKAAEGLQADAPALWEGAVLDAWAGWDGALSTHRERLLVLQTARHGQGGGGDSLTRTRGAPQTDEWGVGAGNMLAARAFRLVGEVALRLIRRWVYDDARRTGDPDAEDYAEGAAFDASALEDPREALIEALREAIGEDAAPAEVAGLSGAAEEGDDASLALVAWVDAVAALRAVAGEGEGYPMWALAAAAYVRCRFGGMDGLPPARDLLSLVQIELPPDLVEGLPEVGEEAPAVERTLASTLPAAMALLRVLFEQGDAQRAHEMAVYVAWSRADLYDVAAERLAAGDAEDLEALLRGAEETAGALRGELETAPSFQDEGYQDLVDRGGAEDLSTLERNALIEAFLRGRAPTEALAQAIQAFYEDYGKKRTGDTHGMGGYRDQRALNRLLRDGEELPGRPDAAVAAGLMEAILQLLDGAPVRWAELNEGDRAVLYRRDPQAVFEEMHRQDLARRVDEASREEGGWKLGSQRQAAQDELDGAPGLEGQQAERMGAEALYGRGAAEVDRERLRLLHILAMLAAVNDALAGQEDGVTLEPSVALIEWLLGLDLSAFFDPEGRYGADTLPTLFADLQTLGDPEQPLRMEQLILLESLPEQHADVRERVAVRVAQGMGRLVEGGKAMLPSDFVWRSAELGLLPPSLREAALAACDREDVEGSLRAVHPALRAGGETFAALLEAEQALPKGLSGALLFVHGGEAGEAGFEMVKRAAFWTLYDGAEGASKSDRMIAVSRLVSDDATGYPALCRVGAFAFGLAEPDTTPPQLQEWLDALVRSVSEMAKAEDDPLTALAEKVAEATVDTLDDLGDWCAEQGDAALDALEEVGEAVWDVVEDGLEWLGEQSLEAFKTAMLACEWSLGALEWSWNQIPPEYQDMALEWLGQMLLGPTEGLLKSAKWLWDLLSDDQKAAVVRAMKLSAKALTEEMAKILDALAFMWEEIAEFLGPVLEVLDDVTEILDFLLAGPALLIRLLWKVAAKVMFFLLKQLWKLFCAGSAGILLDVSVDITWGYPVSTKLRERLNLRESDDQEGVYLSRRLEAAVALDTGAGVGFQSKGRPGSSGVHAHAAAFAEAGVKTAVQQDFVFPLAEEGGMDSEVLFSLLLALGGSDMVGPISLLMANLLKGVDPMQYCVYEYVDLKLYAACGGEAKAGIRDIRAGDTPGRRTGSSRDGTAIDQGKSANWAQRMFTEMGLSGELELEGGVGLELENIEIEKHVGDEEDGGKITFSILNADAAAFAEVRGKLQTHLKVPGILQFVPLLGQLLTTVGGLFPNMDIGLAVRYKQTVETAEPVDNLRNRWAIISALQVREGTEQFLELRLIQGGFDDRMHTEQAGVAQPGGQLQLTFKATDFDTILEQVEGVLTEGSGDSAAALLSVAQGISFDRRIPINVNLPGTGWGALIRNSEKNPTLRSVVSSKSRKKGVGVLGVLDLHWDLTASMVQEAVGLIQGILGEVGTVEMDPMELLFNLLLARNPDGKLDRLLGSVEAMVRFLVDNLGSARLHMELLFGGSAGGQVAAGGKVKAQIDAFGGITWDMNVANEFRELFESGGEETISLGEMTEITTTGRVAAWDAAE